jgi:hypothetical protein
MGYSTDFMGLLKFKHEPTVAELAKLETFMGEDIRSHPDWVEDVKKLYPREYLTYINLEITNDGKEAPVGICWDGSEKSYDMVAKINFILYEMRKDFPDFDLVGTLEAQGEDASDRWYVVMEKGQAVDKNAFIAPEDEEIECPHCHKFFTLKQ